MDAESAWTLIDAYFKDHAYPFTRHHIESFRQFLRHNIPLTIKSYNPITMIKYDTTGEEDFKVEVFVGGIDSDGIRVDRPTMPGPDGAPILQLPYEARIRDQTYQMNLVADVVVRYTVRGIVQPLKTLPGIILGRLPIMLHSDACILHGQGGDVLRAGGECPLDQGGYFLVDGKEKVIISQEQMTSNRLFIEPSPKDADFSFKARIICTGETGETALSPRVVMFKLVRKELPEWDGQGTRGENNDGEDGEDGGARGVAKSDDIATALRPFRGALLVSAPGIAGDLPIATLFRALGVESDEAIVEHILGHTISPDTQEAFLAFLRPSLAQAASSKLYTQKDVWANLQHRVYFEEPNYVAHVLSNDLFPNMMGDAEGGVGAEADWDSLMSRKAKYLGHLVRDIMYVALGIREPSDRDGYAFKRIHVSGMLMSSLFQQAYSKVRDLCRRLLDREYHYGSYKNTGNVTDLIRSDNIHYYLPAAIISDTFQRSLKGAWGYSEDQDPEQGWVQDVSRISYLGYLSHMRRVNNNLDPSLKIASPHRLHSQQWGIMCPFESPDGAAVGYLKNFALLTQISFGTDPAPIRRCLEDLGTLPLRNTSVALDLSACRIFVNGLWFGVHRDPPTLVRRLRSLRRTGLINAFTSITWTIAANEIRVLTEAGRACRPLIRIGPIGKAASNNAFQPMWTPNMPGSWYDLIFGTLLDSALKTKERYYDESYTPPRNIPSLANLSDDALWSALQEHEGVIEFLDIEEVNTQLLALNASAIGPFHTYAEIHPATLLSVVTQNIPFSNHNQAPRNIFHAAQAKQAIGLYATNFNKRYDTSSYILHYPQRAIINTRGAHYTRAVDMPNGVNVIVAVATYTGFNQEDGIILNKHSIDRGLFQISAYKTMTAKEGAPNDRTVVRFSNITDENNEAADASSGSAPIGNVNFADYRLLDKEGLAKAGSKIPKGKKAAIIGLVQEVTQYAEEKRGVASELVKKKTLTNVSRYSDVHHYGVVDKVSVVHADPADGNSYRTAKIRFRKIRRPELGDKHCMTPDHDVLTTQGWVPIAEVTNDHEVCSLTNDGIITYSQPTEVYAYQCENEDMYHIKSQQIDLMTTLKHKMYVKLRGDTKYGLYEAHTIQGKRISYKKNGLNKNEDYHFILPSVGHHIEKNLDMDAWLEFVGFWISDGWACHTSRMRPSRHTASEDHVVEICQVNPVDKDRLIQVIRNLGYTPITSTKNKVKVASEQLASYFLPLSVGAPHKRLPSWVWKLSERQCHVLYEGLRRGDGTVTKSKSDIYFTSSVGLKDDVQRLALHAGWSANVVKRYEAGYDCRLRDGRIIKSSFDSWAVNIVKAKCQPTVNHGHVHKQKVQVEESVVYTGSVHCLEVPSHVFYVRRNGKPVWTGNSSRHGQKGVVGMILPQQDMPFTKDGMVPDVIINPHAFPSRMTVGHLVECVFAKLCCLQGTMGDGTVFLPFDPKDVHRRLEDQGFEGAGNEVLYNGRTGEQIATDIFFGPTFYMRLKHMVADKMHARGDGPKDQLTRQPTSGRSDNGGLRIGEMERDVLLAHGLAAFSKESMMERSDKYAYDICRKCGVVAHSIGQVAQCMSCGGEDIAHVETPYAFKLLLQEMQGMGVELRLRTDTHDAPEVNTLEEEDGGDDEEYEEGYEDDFSNSSGGAEEKPRGEEGSIDKNSSKDNSRDDEILLDIEDDTTVKAGPVETNKESIILDDIDDIDEIDDNNLNPVPETIDNGVTIANTSLQSIGDFAKNTGTKGNDVPNGAQSDIKVINITSGWGANASRDEVADDADDTFKKEEDDVQAYYSSAGADLDPAFATNGYGRSAVVPDISKHLAYPDIIDPKNANMMAGDD